MYIYFLLTAAFFSFGFVEANDFQEQSLVRVNGSSKNKNELDSGLWPKLPVDIIKEILDHVVTDKAGYYFTSCFIKDRGGKICVKDIVINHPKNLSQNS